MYFSIYAGERILFKQTPQFKSFRHFCKLTLVYLQFNYHLFLTRAFSSLIIETLIEDFFLDTYSLASNLQPEDFVYFLTPVHGVVFAPLPRTALSDRA